MPELENFTPFPNLRYYSTDNKGDEFGVIIVKGTFKIAPSGRLLVCEEQAPLIFGDTHHGAVNVTSVSCSSDLVPNKPTTDVIINAIARTEGAKPAPDWLCGIQIERDAQIILRKLLRVTGPRFWEPEWSRALNEEEKQSWRKYRKAFRAWCLSAPQPIHELPLHYEYAFGGSIAKGLNEAGESIIYDRADNPLGCGWLDQEWSDHTIRHRAPQIEDADDPVLEPYKVYKPQNLGPIPAAWEPRLPKAGTYDQNWLDTIWPNWAPDYSFSYHNSAHPDLICHDYLKGSERLRLKGFFADRNLLSIDLPGGAITVTLVASDQRKDFFEMVLDTLYLDLTSPDWRDATVQLSWRLNFQPDLYKVAELHMKAPEQDAGSIRTFLAQSRKQETRA